ncbi:Aste57867_7146 [Aphanomyces stellatus]|uniref:Aste57867_7146 protein n=2 Tax=Aphanomyces stellatus TaxID=120398 RepID=A0A485KF20_9STRA|nr:hypothetical protein As57867_007122 [Aphanomyces stellatus]VFT84078.1 Aste57867_7146 [Aphanomyces stellatus]
MASRPTDATPGFLSLKSPVEDSPCEDLEHGASATTISTATANAGLRVRRDLRKHFLHLPFPLAFFIVFITMVLTHTPIERAYLSGRGLSRALNPQASDIVRGANAVKFMNIRTLDDIPLWLNNSLLPAIFVKNASNGSVLPPSLQGRVATHNKVVGALDLSILNAGRLDSCPSSGDLGVRFGDCYDFDAAYPITDGNASTRNVRKQPWYTLYLPTSNPDPYGRVAKWQRDGTVGGYWFSAATREFDVKLATYNGQLDTLNYVTFKLVMEQGGAIKPSVKMLGVPTNPYATASINMVLDVLVALCTAHLVWKRVVTRQDGMGNVVVEWMTIASVGLYYIFWGRLCFKFYGSELGAQLVQTYDYYSEYYRLLPNMTDDQRTEFVKQSPQIALSDYMDTLETASQGVYVVAILACLQQVINLMTALQFHPSMNILSNTILISIQRLASFFLVFFTLTHQVAQLIGTFRDHRKQLPSSARVECTRRVHIRGSNTILISIQRLASFFLVFLLVVVSLATSGCLLFGQSLAEFCSLPSALVTLVNMLFSNYAFDNIRDINVVAIVWYWVTQAILRLVLFNIMLAIVITAHREIITVHSGTRSFQRECVVVLHDLCTGTRGMNALAAALDAHTFTQETFSAADLVTMLAMDKDDANRLIQRLQTFAAIDPPQQTTAHEPTILLDTTPTTEHLHEKMQELDAKMAILVELLQAQIKSRP